MINHIKHSDRRSSKAKANKMAEGSERRRRFNCRSCEFGYFYIPQRYIVVIMMHFALLNAYHMRMVYNIGITEMVHEDHCNGTDYVDACPEFTYEPSIQNEKEIFIWSPAWTSFTLYAFYFGYIVSHLPGGWMADKLGARHVMGSCMAFSTIITFIFPVVVHHYEYVGAMVLRMLLGLVQGPLLPSVATFVQCWIPRDQRSFLGGIAFSGSNLGTMTGATFTGLMISTEHHWDIPFYVWGALAAAWCAFYMLMVFSHPDNHPFVTEEELLYLKDKVEHHRTFTVPFRKILTTMSFWALLAGQFGHNTIFFTLFTDLPKYLKEIQKMEVMETGLYTTLPFLALWISSIIFALLAQIIINKNWLRVITVRKIYTTFATMTPACFLLVTGYAGCHQEVAIASYTMALFCVGPFFSGAKINVNDLTMHYGGTIMALINGMGCLAGILATSLIGVLTCDCSLESWQLVFMILFGVCTVCTVFYCIFASADRQDWDFKDDIPATES